MIMFIELPNGNLINMDLVIKVQPVDLEYKNKPPESKLKDTYRIDIMTLPGVSFDGNYGESHPVIIETLEFESREIRDGVLKNLKSDIKVSNIDY